MHHFNGNSQCLMLSGVFFSEHNGLISTPVIEELILLPLLFVNNIREKTSSWIKKKKKWSCLNLPNLRKSHRIKQVASPTPWRQQEHRH